MNKTDSIRFRPQMFDEMPIIGILRNVSHQDVLAILPLYAQAGLTTLEITMNSHNAEKIIQDAVSLYGHSLNIGAGTVCTMDDLDKALEAGAQFIVTPIVNEDVIKTCVTRNIPVFPGAFTPTEIWKAWNLGATMVKVFPANILEIQYFKNISAPLGPLKLLATGGVDLNAIDDYLDAGVRGFGIGSPLFKASYLENKDWNNLAIHFQKFARKFKGYT